MSIRNKEHTKLILIRIKDKDYRLGIRIEDQDLRIGHIKIPKRIFQDHSHLFKDTVIGLLPLKCFTT